MNKVTGKIPEINRGLNFSALSRRKQKPMSFRKQDRFPSDWRD